MVIKRGHSAWKGYTLIEMMLVVAIIGILFASAYPLMRQMTNFWRMTTARNAIQRDVRTTLDMINRFTRQAQAGTVVISKMAGQPPYSALQFTMKDQDGNDQAVVFYQKGNKLYMQKGAGTTVLTSNLAYIAFTFPRSDDTSILSVAITTQSPTFLGGKKALQLSIQKVRIMN